MLAVTAALTLTAATLVHEDDPKILDRVAPYSGPAYRRDVAMRGRGAEADLSGNGESHAVGGFPSSNVTLLSWLPLNTLDGAQSGNDIWGYVSPSGREYALMGTYESTVFVEVTDPGNAQVVDIVPGPSSLWRDVKTYDHYAYSVSEGGGGIQVIDLSGIDSGSVELVGNVDGNGLSATHNVAIDEVSGFLYRSGGGGNGLRIYDLADPANPTYVRSWSQRYVHDLQAVTHTSGAYAGRQLVYLCDGLNGGFGLTRLEILDVTDKQNFRRLSWSDYPNRAYAHQGWLDPSRSFFFLGDELDEDGSLDTTTYIMDVSDPGFITYAGSFTNGSSAIGHNLYTRGNVIYAANYRSGLRVFDASDPYNPVEIGYFDTWPNNDNDNFNGLWGVYPYLPSGILLGSDMERGLFVWSAVEPGVQIVLPEKNARTIPLEGETVPIDFLETTPGTIVSRRAFVDSGSGFAEVPLRAMGGARYELDLPSLSCTEHVSWYVEASSQGGATWTHPVGAPAHHHVSLAGKDVRARTGNGMEPEEPAWTVGAPGDDATSGFWVAVDPRGTAAQPEDDRTPGVGSRCWVTGQGSPGGAVDAADVDGGRTSLVTDLLDLSENTDPVVSFWFWYSNDQGGEVGADVLEVEVSTDGGSSWIPIDVIGPTGPYTHGGWHFRAIRLNDFVAGTAETRVRFVASDEGQPSVIEAAIDDFRISEALCRDCNENGVSDELDVLSASLDLNNNAVPDECDCPTEIYCLGLPNVLETGATMAAYGRTNLSMNEFELEVYDASPLQPCFFFYGGGRGQIPFGDGVRCISSGGQGIHLMEVQRTDVFGEVSIRAPFPDPRLSSAESGGRIRPGSTWNFQLWYRDPLGPGGTGFNASDAMAVTFCP